MELKQKILDATDGGRLIFERLYPDSSKVFNASGKGMIKIRDEKTASTGFKKMQDGTWLMRDFGADITLNAIDAYIKETGILYFKEALYRLADEYHVDFSLNKKVNKANIRQSDATENDKEGKITWEEKELNTKELEVMGATVTQECMEKYNYKALKWYKSCKRNEKGELKVTTFSSSDNYPIFLHDCGEFQKIYKPLEFEKQYRFFIIGSKPLDYINGLNEAKKELNKRLQEFRDTMNDTDIKEKTAMECSGLVNKKLPEIIICSGERDAMCLAGMGYVPVWFNSETAKKTSDDIDKLFALADKVYNVPDMDDTGIAQGKSLALQHIAIYTIELPKWLSSFKDARSRPCKDLRDYIELRPSKSEFEKLLKSAQRVKFWERKANKIEIRALNLLYFLKLNGFRKYKDPITGEIKIIRIDGYTVTEYQPVQVRDFIRQSMNEMQAGNEALEAFINSKKTTKQIYDDLDTVDIDFNNSTVDSRTLFFQNVCLTVKHNLINSEDKKMSGIEMSTTPSNNKFVWDTKIIPHKFQRLEPAFSFDWKQWCLIPHLENNPSKMFRYLINASRLFWREEIEYYKDPAIIEPGKEYSKAKLKELNELNAQANKKYAEENQFNIYGPRLDGMKIDKLEENPLVLQAQCLLNKLYIIGYLIHRYKIASNAKAVWAMEWKNPQEGVSNGRSGKSLFFKGLKELGLCEIETLQGRIAKLTDNNFFLDRITKSTDILLIDDIKKGADFETFYTMITGSMTINPKNEKSFELKYEDAPNIAFTSNFAPPNMDASTLARILFMVFSDYYHTNKGDDTSYLEERKVNDELGELWDINSKDEDYNADINFCLDCLQFYLAARHLNAPTFEPPMAEVMKRSQEQNMGAGFLRWARQYFDPADNHLNRPIVRQAAYDDYDRSIKRGEERKSTTGWLRAVKLYVKFCDNLECINPPQHPWYRKEGDRLSAKAMYGGKSGAMELIYIKTKDNDNMSTEIINY